MPIYEIRSLKHSYDGEPVLSIDHLTIKQAHIVGLIGPNGSGKSTLLRLLGLIERPIRGEIFFNGRRVEPFSAEARFLITLLPQEPFLMKRSVYNNISYGLKLRGNGRDIVDKVTQAPQSKGNWDSDNYHVRGFPKGKLVPPAEQDAQDYSANKPAMKRHATMPDCNYL